MSAPDSERRLANWVWLVRLKSSILFNNASPVLTMFPDFGRKRQFYSHS